MNAATILFANSEHNYTTSLSHTATKESAERYFVGRFFNVGSFIKEDLQECIGIIFTKSN